MDALLNVFACRKSSVHEEAMLAVGAMTYACGRQFSKYLERFFPVLQMGLAQHQEWQVCQVTVGVLGDVCRAIEDQIYPFCDPVMQTLLTNLQSPDVHRNVKPQILSAFGDIALAIGDRFEKYLQHVVSMLQSAMQLSVQQQQGADEDLIDYNNLLRHGILEAWAGMFNGLSKDKAEAYLKPYAPPLLEFVEAIWNNQAGHDDGEWQLHSIALLLLSHCCAVCGRTLLQPGGARRRRALKERGGLFQPGTPCHGLLGQLRWPPLHAAVLQLQLAPCLLPLNTASLNPSPSTPWPQACSRRRRRCWATWPPRCLAPARCSSRSRTCSRSCSSWRRTAPPRTQPTGPAR
jgi:hypothetical protein